MKTNSLKQGSISVNLSGVGIVTWEKVKQRAAEIALINGRSAHKIHDSDWIEARRELTGEIDEDPLLGFELLGDVATSEPRSGYETPGEDTDQEGHSTSARLVEQGIEEAEHDTMLKAARKTAS